MVSFVALRWFVRLGLAGLLAVIVYAIVGMLLSLVTVNGQPDSGNDVVVCLVEFGIESLRTEILPLDGV